MEQVDYVWHVPFNPNYKSTMSVCVCITSTRALIYAFLHLLPHKGQNPYHPPKVVLALFRDSIVFCIYDNDLGGQKVSSDFSISNNSVDGGGVENVMCCEQMLSLSLHSLPPFWLQELTNQYQK